MARSFAPEDAAEASSWNRLHAHYDLRKVNRILGYSIDDACTNQAESWFSRLRRAEIGIHHHINAI